MNDEFKSIKELYDRIKPALISRSMEFKKIGYKNIREADIWNFLTSSKWQKSVELTLSEMVEDIFKVDPEDVINYMIKQVSKEMREPFFDE